MQKGEKNIIVSFLKVFFAYEVALAHYNKSFVLFTGRWCVDYYFIISGYFLLNSFYSEKYKTSVEYTLQRVKRIYPYYLSAFLLLEAYSFFRTPSSFLTDPIGKIAQALPELFLLQNIGWFDGGVNYPLWYLCCLFIASHIYFSLLQWNRKLVLQGICPIIALMFGAYYINVYNNHVVSLWDVKAGVFYIPLWRSFCFLGIGLMLREVVSMIPHDKYESINGFKKSDLALFFIFLILFIHERNRVSSYLPFISLLYLSSCIHIKQSKLLIDIAKVSEKLQLSVFLNHALIIKVFNDASHRIKLSTNTITCLFIIALTFLSLSCYYVITYLLKKTKKNSIKRRTVS